MDFLNSQFEAMSSKFPQNEAYSRIVLVNPYRVLNSYSYDKDKRLLTALLPATPQSMVI